MICNIRMITMIPTIMNTLHSMECEEYEIGPCAGFSQTVILL